MKKTIQILCVLASLAVVITSCKKDEMVNVVTTNGIATISGVAEYNPSILDDSLANGVQHGSIAAGGEDLRTMSNVPEGTIIYARIATEDLTHFAATGATDYGDKTITATIAADGTYELEIPANTDLVTVNITADEFRATEVVSDTVSASNVYGLTAFAITVVDGMTRIRDLEFIEQ